MIANGLSPGFTVMLAHHFVRKCYFFAFKAGGINYSWFPDNSRAGIHKIPSITHFPMTVLLYDCKWFECWLHFYGCQSLCEKMLLFLHFKAGGINFSWFPDNSSREYKDKHQLLTFPWLCCFMIANGLSPGFSFMLAHHFVENVTFFAFQGWRNQLFLVPR